LLIHPVISLNTPAGGHQPGLGARPKRPQTTRAPLLPIFVEEETLSDDEVEDNTENPQVIISIVTYYCHCDQAH